MPHAGQVILHFTLLRLIKIKSISKLNYLGIQNPSHESSTILNNFSGISTYEFMFLFSVKDDTYGWAKLSQVIFRQKLLS